MEGWFWHYIYHEGWYAIKENKAETKMHSLRIIFCCILQLSSNEFSSVVWGCRINRLPPCRGVRPPTRPNKCPGYDIKPSDGETLDLELWGMWSTLFLTSLPGTHWLGVVALDRILSMGLIELIKHSTVCKEVTVCLNCKWYIYIAIIIIIMSCR